jgi:triosephosphate isomerase (TIM)
MRKQIAAANWKMNLTYPQAENLLSDVLNPQIDLKESQEVLFAVPYPYLIMANAYVATKDNYFAAAQNCYSKNAGAYTGEVSAEMLHSLDIEYCVIGHSERREYFGESNQMLAEKTNLCLQYDVTPIFCCGEPLSVREAQTQNAYVTTQLQESLFHLTDDQIKKLVIAYEPIWAIGTGKTATTAQAQEMHKYLRSVLSKKYGENTAGLISILYGGSVKAANAKELFSCEDVDGGLVGGASLIAADFIQIINALKK